MRERRHSKNSLMRVLAYITQRHRGQITLVAVAILCSVAAGLLGNMFVQVIIDDYILRMISTGEDLFSKLFRFLLLMAVVYAVGVVGTCLYNRTMAVVAQSVLKEIRDDLFSNMQRLPIRFFDTHTHGDIMSVYTNDTDTLRQFIAQSLPMLFSSVINIVLTFCVMIHYSPWLTLIVLAITVVMLLVSSKLLKISGSNFVKQQATIGKVNGYIEEMLNPGRMDSSGSPSVFPVPGKASAQ